MHTGSCLCGAVTFKVEGPLPPPDACHCTACRKFSGHFQAGTDVPRSALTVEGMEHVTWYASSAKVRRGFCSVCGASLFFDPLHTDKHAWTSVCMGAFDTPTETRLAVHIFVDDKGDYYDIADGLPQNRQ
ncbi:MAG: hypothetical protein ACI8PZ_001270 [Myxococcota bacterium]|jgi:hypothetical protein